MILKKIQHILVLALFLCPMHVFAQDDLIDLEFTKVSPVMEDISLELSDDVASMQGAEMPDLSRQEEVPPYLQDELDAVVEKPVDYVEPVQLGPTIFRMLAALSLVLVLLFLVLLLVKKFGPYSTVDSKGMISVLEHSALAPGKSLHLVKVGGELMLLASDNNGIVFIKSINSPVLSGNAQINDRVKNSDFRQTLASKVSGFKPDEAIKKDFVMSSDDSDIQSNIHDIHAQIKKLKKMKSDLNEID